MPKIYTSKVCVVGDQGVGKTSLLLKYSKNTFFENYKPTLGADFIIKEEKIEGTDDFCHLYLWDLAGNKSFAILRNYYMHGANAAIVCFDLNNPESFKNVSSWLKDVNKIRANIPIILVGTKNDLNQEVHDENIEKYITEKNLPFFKTSAKEGENVRDVFMKMIDMILSNAD